ncbi:MAG: tetratricopeptide repeat protein, partial [Verrucomicrobiota bacterium]|nr:tetratricopeptide repeat protein [Verrucomicrobiota bacterium]
MEVGRFFLRIVFVVIALLLAPNFFAAAPPKGEFVDAEVHYKMGVGYFRAGEPAEAVRWFERAAKSNHTRAQGMLGLCHYAGRGVPLDFDKAAYWLARAAAKEDAIAQFSLARLYVNGQGVPRNQ